MHLFQNFVSGWGKREMALNAIGLRWTAGAYSFTASTSFANPAVTLARAASDTFSGIRPADAPGFILAQPAGAAAATALFRWLVPALPKDAAKVIVPHTQAEKTHAR